MQVRQAKRSDLPGLLLLAEQFHGEDPAFSNLPFDAAVTMGTFGEYLRKQFCCLLVVESNENLAGFFMGHVSRAQWGTFREAFEDFFYVLPAHRAEGAGRMLLDAYVEWARNMGATVVGSGLRSRINEDAAAQLLESAGFAQIGTLWVHRGG